MDACIMCIRLATLRQVHVDLRRPNGRLEGGYMLEKLGGSGQMGALCVSVLASFRESLIISDLLLTEKYDFVT